MCCVGGWYRFDSHDRIINLLDGKNRQCNTAECSLIRNSKSQHSLVSATLKGIITMNEHGYEDNELSRTDTSRITLFPENFDEIQSTQQKKLGNLLLGYASLLLIGGIISYSFWYLKDTPYRNEGVTTSAVIDWFDVQTKVTRSKGRSSSWTTNTINYHYSSELGVQASGSDTVKTWRHIPKSSSGIAPKNNEEILIEYLKSDPKTSRLLIPNRYQQEYIWSAIAIAAAVLLLFFRWIQTFENRVRYQVFGMGLLITGSALLTWAIYFAFVQRQENHNPDDRMVLILLYLLVLVPSILTILWIGWFFFSSARLSPSDPRQLVGLLTEVNKKDGITMLAYRYYGTRAAILFEKESKRVHFVNCHVKKGFLPWVIPLYSCSAHDLIHKEKDHKTKYGKTITQSIITTPTGSTSIYHHVPGVLEFLHKLNCPPSP